ncbi:winged helix-turn-helix transcriptional regulator [Candidatus Gottesmanbacteria bacterium]|nr:winged helix-turn-helix transcriptional regulator [Candidatus Gottesmanbacteria bacterium]
MLSSSAVLKLRKVVQKGNDDPLKILKALSDQTRLKLFQLLIKRKELCVSDLAKIFRISPSAVSYQLKFLERAGLVKRIKMGQIVCYEIKKSDNMVKSVINFIQKKRV